MSELKADIICCGFSGCKYTVHAWLAIAYNTASLLHLWRYQKLPCQFEKCFMLLRIIYECLQ